MATVPHSQTRGISPDATRIINVTNRIHVGITQNSLHSILLHHMDANFCTPAGEEEITIKPSAPDWAESSSEQGDQVVEDQSFP
jgi:hypothetical protein